MAGVLLLITRRKTSEQESEIPIKAIWQEDFTFGFIALAREK